MIGARRERSSFAIGLLLIAMAALTIRVLFVVVVDPEVPRIGDASAYHLLAENLADGKGYIRPFDQELLGKTRATAEYPPLFPSVVAVPAFLGVHSVEGQRLFVAFIGAGTVVLIGLLGRRLGGEACGLVAGAIAACYPMLFLGEATLMAESLSVPLATAVVLLAYRLID
jgi:4-amino-4-deoxy-L-arabinose transferase-like glycosyltransferase